MSACDVYSNRLCFRKAWGLLLAIVLKAALQIAHTIRCLPGHYVDVMYLVCVYDCNTGCSSSLA